MRENRMKTEKEIHAKIEDSIEALKDFSSKKSVSPEEFFTIARQATFLTALFWVIDEPVPAGVTKLAVPIIQKMTEAQLKSAEEARKETEESEKKILADEKKLAERKAGKTKK